MSEVSKRMVSALQALRAVAALLVVADHSIATSIAKAGSSPDLLPFAYRLGEIGVQIFFAISGLVMIISHGQDFRRAGAPSEFLMKRLTRLVPLYWLATAVYYMKERAVGSAVSGAALTLSLLFVPYFTQGKPFGQPVYGLGWTLQYEMFFYLVFAVSLALHRKLGLAFVGLVLVGLVVFGSLFEPRPSSLLVFYTRPVVLYFLFGLMLGLFRDCSLVRAASCSFGAALTLAIVTVAFGVGSSAILPQESSLYTLVQTLVCCASVLVCGVAREQSRWTVAKHAAKMTGDASYSIYLTHPFIIGPLGRLSSMLSITPIFMLIIALPASTILGLLCYRFVERPMVTRASRIGTKLVGR